MTDEPSQPLATSLGNLSSGFGALTGIEEARDAQVRNQTTLDKLIEVGEYVITKYISAKANSDYDTEIQQEVLGMYTGALLQLLTKRNKEQGKPAIFHFNGRGNRFDYLFYFAKFIDDIIIENFTGKYICSMIGSYDGNLNQIMCINIEGDSVCSGVGSYNG